MKKFLYFSAGTPDGTASTEEVACFPADQLSHFELASATSMRVYFNSNQEQDLSGVDSAHAVLTILVNIKKLWKLYAALLLVLTLLMFL
jgi:hypothetical protein